MKKFALIVAVMALFIISCSNIRTHEKVIFENKTSKISLESKEENKKIVNNLYAHPAVLNVKTLKNLLKSISYFEEKGLFSGKKKAPVFNTSEISALAPGLMEGLKKADSSQRIHFISFNRGDGGIFNHLRKTEGFVFVKPAGRINIAFCLVNHENRPHENDDPVEVEEKINPFKPGNSGTPVFSTLSEVKNHEFENGEKSPAWLVADTDILEKVVEKTEIKKPEERSVDREKIGEKGDKWNEEKEKIRVRLEYIKDLFSQGLISKQDYEAKKKELLKQID
ncbi:MAG: hypothetical protein GXP53_01340 [Deltaproteobacteria bacterium]|nr:hypothetical protein [Deltaproteobacteria bacterium]